MPGATALFPASVAVPSPLSVKVTRDGRLDPEARVIAGVGRPVVFTMKVKGLPGAAVTLVALVIDGALGGSIAIMTNADWDEVIEPKANGVVPEGSKTSTGAVLQNPTLSAHSAPLSVPSPNSPKELSPQA